MGTIAFLVLFPVLPALILLVVRNDRARTFITVVSSLVIAVAALFLSVEFIAAGSVSFTVPEQVVHVADRIALVIEVALCLYIVAKGMFHHKYLAVLLGLIQLVLACYLDLGVMDAVNVSHALYVDNLSIIMSLIIGIVGSGIVVYALGYMRVHEAHAAGPDRRHIFFPVMFVFLGAMFAVVLCNQLTWMLCAWEVTTVCSFALIGYTRTPEAIKNSFLQIVLNLVGGIAFSIALIWVGRVYGVNELDSFLSTSLVLMQSGYTVLVYLPVLLLALAGFTKAAQMPFQSWLLGAMVAPTPTSALLHSSTMVKAGVFLLIKLAPLFGFNLPGYIVMLVGGITFLLCALAAIGQSNAKRVLAYSTISNLGLICACAGVGTDGAVWAAIFLVVFHAVAKSLLFCCVGTAEHCIGSRDIEDMDDLFERAPRLARLMALGIMGMFVAPFGMLVSKWAALQSFTQSSNIVLLMLLVFGSAATFVFWAKWLGKVLAVANDGSEDTETGVSTSEWASLGVMAVLTVGCCIAFPLISTSVVEPYLSTVFSTTTSAISGTDLWIMAVIALVVAVILLGFTGATKKRIVPVYMAGATADAAARSFPDSLGNPQTATQRNWYMTGLLPEATVKLAGIVVALALIVGSIGFTMQTVASSADTVAEGVEIQQTYHDSQWYEGGASYATFIQYYEYYKDYYENYGESLSQEMGINSMTDLMNALYEEMNASSSTDADDASADDGASTDETGEEE